MQDPDAVNLDPWTSEEVETAKYLRDSGYSSAEVGRLLNRSGGAVRAVLSRTRTRTNSSQGADVMVRPVAGLTEEAQGADVMVRPVAGLTEEAYELSEPMESSCSS